MTTIRANTVTCPQCATVVPLEVETRTLPTCRKCGLVYPATDERADCVTCDGELVMVTGEWAEGSCPRCALGFDLRVDHVKG